MSTTSVTELQRELGHGGTFFAAAGLVGAVLGLVLLVVLVADLAPEDQLSFVVGVLTGWTAALFVSAHVWLLIRFREQ